MTDEELRRAEHRLLAGAATYACGGYIARLDALHRNDLYTRLAYDRLERKYDVVRELFAESDSNWNQTFYVLLFRTIGDVTNRDAFLTLARRVSYRMVLRERDRCMPSRRCSSALRDCWTTTATTPTPVR